MKKSDANLNYWRERDTAIRTQKDPFSQAKPAEAKEKCLPTHKDRTTWNTHKAYEMGASGPLYGKQLPVDPPRLSRLTALSVT